MGIEMPDINKIREEIDKNNSEMEKKRQQKIKEEYEGLSEQEKPTEEPIEEKKDKREDPEEKKKEGAEKKIKDENIVQKLNPENIKAAENLKTAYKKGKFIEVKVKGSSGEIEDGWVISNIDPKTGEVTVLKSTSEKGKDESFVDKIVTLEELKEWNKPETKEPKEKKEDRKNIPIYGSEVYRKIGNKYSSEEDLMQSLDSLVLAHNYYPPLNNTDKARKELIEIQYKEIKEELTQRINNLKQRYDYSLQNKASKALIEIQYKKIEDKLQEIDKRWQKGSEIKTEGKSKDKEGNKEKDKGQSQKESKSNGKEKKSEENQKKEDLEKEITGNFYDELKKIKDMPDKAGGFNKTAKLKMKKTEKCFELIDNWKDSAYLDDYKGIKKIFSELDKLKPSMFFYNLKKSQIINNVGLTMALNYQEWDLEDKKKLKIIKNFVNGQSEKENIFYPKDKTLKGIAQILASEDIPFKGNIDVIVKNIENPDIKSETIAEILKIENESIKEKKELLKQTKENIAEEKMPSEEKIKEQAKRIGVSEEIISKLLTEGSEILKDQDVQKKVQELKDVIEKKAKEKGKIPDCVAKTKKFIEEKDKDKKESPWKTAFGVAGFGILLFLVLFMLAELKGIDYLSGQAVGGKKKEKK